uniref:Uncharacterized protein n=1 Tax=Solanum lycopersicum TaxID=4081 RepID=A0A3Q7GUM5_SOLLC
MVFDGIFRCYAVVIAVIVVVAETEWAFFIKFWKLQSGSSQAKKHLPSRKIVAILLLFMQYGIIGQVGQFAFKENSFAIWNTRTTTYHPSHIVAPSQGEVPQTPRWSMEFHTDHELYSKLTIVKFSHDCYIVDTMDY